MGLVISAKGIIKTSQPRSVISQINADVLALLDARYFYVDRSVGAAVDKVTVHGNQKSDYRYLRTSTNANNKNAPVLSEDESLRFDGNASLRTNNYDDIASEFTLAFVLRFDASSPSGMFFRLGDATVAATGKNLYFNATNQTISLRQNVTSIITESIDLDRYATILVSCSKDKSLTLISNTIAEGLPVDFTNKYYQLMSADSAAQPTGNLKYFSMYKGAATEGEMFKLQQILQQNFNL